MVPDAPRHQPNVCIQCERDQKICRAPFSAAIPAEEDS